MNTVELARAVENTIKLMLSAKRLVNPTDSAVSRLYVYDQVTQINGKHGIITTGFFSRIVGDMKKTGIIGTSRGGEVLFLTDAYWKLSGGEAQLAAYNEKRESLAIWILHEIEKEPRNYKYFYDRANKNLVDEILKFCIGSGDLVLEEGLYRLSDATRLRVDTNKKEQVGGGK